MSTNNQQVPSAQGDRSTTQVWWVVLLSLLVFFAAADRQTFWIDEISTAYQAEKPTFSDWWEHMRTDKSSNLQMPFYMVYTWGWEKFFSTDELWFRFSNYPFLLAGFLAIHFAFKDHSRFRWMFLLVMSLNAFVWFYLNEARPYAIQIGLSCVLFAATYRLSDISTNKTVWAWLFAISAFLLSASSMLAMVFVGGLLLALVMGLEWSGLQRLVRQHKFAWAVLTLSLGALAIYYLWTLKQGARATDVGRTGWENIPFVIYELAGFTGLGPGRLDIRAEGLRSFKPYLGVLLPAGVLFGLLFWSGYQQLRRKISNRLFWGMTLGLGVAVLFLLTVGVVKDFRVLGRHFTPLAPVLFAVLALGLVNYKNANVLKRVLAFFFLAGALFSGLSLRYAERHAKDDYRGAAAITWKSLESGQTVWWNADVLGPVFYQPAHKIVNQPVIWMNATWETIQKLPLPDVVVVSKPDVYDVHLAVQKLLQEQGYEVSQKIQAFTIWRKGRI